MGNYIRWSGRVFSVGDIEEGYKGAEGVRQANIREEWSRQWVQIKHASCL